MKVTTRLERSATSERPALHIVMFDGREVGMLEKYRDIPQKEWHPWKAYAGIGAMAQSVGAFYDEDGGKAAAIQAVVTAILFPDDAPSSAPRTMPLRDRLLDVLAVDGAPVLDVGDLASGAARAAATALVDNWEDFLHDLGGDVAQVAQVLHDVDDVICILQAWKTAVYTAFVDADPTP